ncbi:U3 small nucleolar ribonucleoprotein IMP4 [Tolypocladium capitatum]|uniref:U3 small nucleolar ribonucleoprotein IMP4 n=1 Tax=Tolypocladium capitatum TaxID=45235 RepID=A0A2K3QFS7_9HYPO|nr:U3 small nucleolar ribonucleoprotein IMP4 [Tolypocladium capitatum]
MTKNEQLDLDDEDAQLSGIVDPSSVTTSRNPSARLAAFAKEVRLLILTSMRTNRGSQIFQVRRTVRHCPAS